MTELEVEYAVYVLDVNWTIGGRLLLMVRIAVLIEPSVAPPVGWLSARFTVTELAVWAGLTRIVTLKVLSISPAWKVSVPEAAV